MGLKKKGTRAPEFRLPDEKGREVSLKDLRGKKVVLYFYPKDDTPGCTKEACGFRDEMARIKRRGAIVLGVSRDPVERHEKFKKKYRLNFPLLSDPDARTIRAYGAWQKKKMYGKERMGIVRSTFLIDEEGKISEVWPKVKPADHPEEVLEALKR